MGRKKERGVDDAAITQCMLSSRSLGTKKLACS